MRFSREWGMPSSDTFSCAPIGGFVKRYLEGKQISVDPFARNKDWFTHTNDLNPDTSAQYHMDAVDYLEMLSDEGLKADLVIVDPPYSPRQISECYKHAGLKAGITDTQSSFYTRIRNSVMKLCHKETIVLSFGWNSTGMGKTNGFEIIEIMLVAHGGAHNDTICMAERCIQERLI